MAPEPARDVLDAASPTDFLAMQDAVLRKPDRERRMTERIVAEPVQIVSGVAGASAFIGGMIAALDSQARVPDEQLGEYTSRRAGSKL